MRELIALIAEKLTGTVFYKPVFLIVTILGLAVDIATWYIAIKSGPLGFIIIYVNRLLLAEYQIDAGEDVDNIRWAFKEVFGK